MEPVFHYENYRDYLKDYYRDQKTRRTGFTYARFSSSAGLGSPNYFKLVMDGEKNLTTEKIIRFSKGLKLQPEESEYFEALVQFNQCTKPMEREYYRERLGRIREIAAKLNQNKRTVEEYEFESMSSWLHHAVLVLTNVKGFRESPRWIRERLFNLATESEINSVIETLIYLGLLVRNKDRRLVQSHRRIKTQPELRRWSARLFYEGLLARASQSLRIGEPGAREFGSYMVGVSPSQLPEIKRRVREFMESLNEFALENPDPSQIYSFVFCGFPLSSPDRPETAKSQRSL